MTLSTSTNVATKHTKAGITYNTKVREGRGRVCVRICVSCSLELVQTVTWCEVCLGGICRGCRGVDALLPKVQLS